MAPTSTYTEAVATQIVDRLAEGEFLRVICRSEGMPSWRTVYRWIEEHDEFAARIAHARIAGFDALAEESLVMLDQAPEKCPAGMFGEKVDAGHVQWMKNRAEQRLKLLAKWAPKKYGDKQEITHKVDEDLTARILAGRRRAGSE